MLWNLWNVLECIQGVRAMLALACSQFVQYVYCVKCCIAMTCLCALTIKSWCNRATAGWLRKLQQTVLPAFNSEVLKSLKMLSCSQLFCPDSTSCIELTMPRAINMSNTCWLELGRFFCVSVDDGRCPWLVEYANSHISSPRLWALPSWSKWH